MSWFKRVIIVMIIIPFPVFAQYVNCFDESGIGMFEGANPTADWSLWTETGSGSLSLESSLAYAGPNSIKAVVNSGAAGWHIRMLNTGCEFNLVNEKFYKVSFFINTSNSGEIDVALRNGGTTIETKRASVVSTNGWEELVFIFKSTTTSSNGRIYLNFRTEGEYYIDNITIAETDCHGDLGGTASIDNCGYCAGGNTAIQPDVLCNVYSIAPTDSKIKISGTLSQKSHPEGLEIHRFTEDFLTNGVDGNWNPSVARTQSGVTFEIKTNSPVVNFMFSDLENSDQRNANYAIYKNGVLFDDYISQDTIEIINLSGESVHWKVSVSVFRGVVFNGVELAQGFTPEDLGNEERLAYYAIGNSITHGNGQDHGGHLSYPFRVADSLNFHLHNLGIGGSKVTLEMLRNFQTPDADYITFLWGYNDLFGPTGFEDQGGLFEKYEAFIDSLCVLQPQAQIYVILQTPSTTVAGNAGKLFQDLRSYQITTVDELMLEHTNLHVIESYDYVNVNTDLTDAVHLNLQGAENLANGIIEEILSNDPDLVTGFDHLEKEKNGVYPNPTTGMIHLSNEMIYVLYDLLGAQVLSGTSREVNLSGLSNGVYLLQADGKMTRIIKK